MSVIIAFKNYKDSTVCKREIGTWWLNVSPCFIYFSKINVFHKRRKYKFLLSKEVLRNRSAFDYYRLKLNTFYNVHCQPIALYNIRCVLSVVKKQTGKLKKILYTLRLFVSVKVATTCSATARCHNDAITVINLSLTLSLCWLLDSIQLDVEWRKWWRMTGES